MCNAFIVHRLVCAPLCMCTALYVDYGSLRSMRPRTPPGLQDSCCGHRPPFVCNAFIVHRLVCAPPCVCAALRNKTYQRGSPAVSGIPTAAEWGAKSEVAHLWARWLRHPCRLCNPHRFRAEGKIRSGPLVGKVATSPSPSRGSPPLRSGGQNQKWATCGQSGYVKTDQYAVGKQANKRLEHPTFCMLYRNSIPGFPHGHQTLVVTRFHAAPTLIAEWGTTSVARLAAPLGEWMDRTQCSVWVTAAPPRQGPLVRGLTIAFNMCAQQTTFV